MSGYSDAEIVELRRSLGKLREMLTRLAPLDGNLALAITSAALVEDSLKGLLRAFARKEFAGKFATAPVHSIAKILLLIGLINEKEACLVGAIGQLRNSFAHNWRHTSFYDRELEISVAKLRNCAVSYANTKPDDMFQPMDVGVGQLLIYLTTSLVMSLTQREISARRLRASIDEDWPPSTPDISSGLMFILAGTADTTKVDLVFAAPPANSEQRSEED